MIAFFSNLAGPDIAIICVILLLLFGAKQIPRWARAIRETRDELNDITKEDKK